jgi:hypothetical protein
MPIFLMMAQAQKLGPILQSPVKYGISKTYILIFYYRSDFFNCVGLARLLFTLCFYSLCEEWRPYPPVFLNLSSELPASHLRLGMWPVALCEEWKFDNSALNPEIVYFSYAKQLTSLQTCCMPFDSFCSFIAPVI